MTAVRRGWSQVGDRRPPAVHAAQYRLVQERSRELHVARGGYDVNNTYLVWPVPTLIHRYE